MHIILGIKIIIAFCVLIRLLGYCLVRCAIACPSVTFSRLQYRVSADPCKSSSSTHFLQFNLVILVSVFFQKHSLHLILEFSWPQSLANLRIHQELIPRLHVHRLSANRIHDKDEGYFIGRLRRPPSSFQSFLSTSNVFMSIVGTVI